jgi:hypothetical protein
VSEQTWNSQPITYQGQLVSGNLEGGGAFEVGGLLVKNQLVVGLECGDDLRTHSKKTSHYIDLYWNGFAILNYMYNPSYK